MRNPFLGLLVVELIIIGIVGLVFRVIESRLVAGSVAGSIFLALGIWIFVRGLKARDFRRTPTFFAGCVHLFVTSLPMVIIRLLNHSSAFENVQIWGMAGPSFHRLSTAIYFALIIATAWDAWRFRVGARARS